MHKIRNGLVWLLLAGMAGCGVPARKPMAGRVLHGRYLDPAGQFSIRVPPIPRRFSAIQDEVHGSSGRVTFPAFSSSGLEWFTATRSVEITILQDKIFLRKFVDQRAAREARLIAEYGSAEIVHQEYIPWREDQGDFYVVQLPQGGPLGTRAGHLTFFHFVEGNTAYLLHRVWRRPYAAGGRHMAAEHAVRSDPWGRAREGILGMAAGIAFEDPLLGEGTGALHVGWRSP